MELARLQVVAGGLSSDSHEPLSEVEKLGIERKVFQQLSQQARRRYASDNRFVRSMIQVAAAVVIFVTGYGVKSIVNRESDPMPEIIDRIELRSDYSRMHASTMRFSKEGLKLITKGKRSWEETWLRATATN
jgi:hypothetical protein